ncbi:udp-sugar [Fragilaria crotonensis]|nr:udp-sugar [Fragilaria crotonensis]
MEIKNLIDHGTFILGQKPHADELIIPVKLVLKAKQTASGKLDKLKARLVARGDMEKRRIKKQKQKYAKYFGVPLLLDKGIYGLVYSGKYWNIEFSEWLYSQGFIQSQAEPSYFVYYDKHNQWLRLLFFVDDMLYVGSNDSIEKSFEDSVRNRFDVKFLGPAQWFLQMRIHRHKDSTYTLDQHRYVLNALQRYDPHSEFPERETPFPPDYVFTKDNRPVTDHDKSIIEKRHSRLPFRSAVCTLLYLAYNTRADILFAVCKLAKACICPGELDFRALIWLFGYLRRRPSYALKFYPDGTSNPIYSICAQHSIPYSDLTVFSDASWQDCPDTGRSTVGYMIFTMVLSLKPTQQCLPQLQCQPLKLNTWLPVLQLWLLPTSECFYMT